MKKIFFFIFLMISISACKKNPVDSNPLDKDYLSKLEGSWRWIETNGGIAGVHIKPVEGGETKFFNFTTYCRC